MKTGRPGAGCRMNGMAAAGGNFPVARNYPIDVLCSFCSSPGVGELPSIKDRHCQGRMDGAAFYQDLVAWVDGCAGDLYCSGIAGMGRGCVDGLQGIYLGPISGDSI